MIVSVAVIVDKAQLSLITGAERQSTGLRADTLFRETDDESLPEFSDGAIGEAEVIVEFGGY
eukprot:scaffold28412_cov48-Cyclotella_meneghiniana.AAC.6